MPKDLYRDRAPGVGRDERSTSTRKFEESGVRRQAVNTSFESTF